MIEKKNTRKWIWIPVCSSSVFPVGLKACQVGWVWKIIEVAKSADLLEFPCLQNAVDITFLYP